MTVAEAAARDARPPAGVAAGDAGSLGLGAAALLSALTGFLALSYEIMWVRVHGFATRGEANAFGDLLGAYLAGVAVGSFLARRWCAAHGGTGRRIELAALQRCLVLATALAFVLVPLAGEAVRVLPPSAVLVLFALAAGLQGTALPLLAHASIPPDGEAGARLARLYLANIAGCAAGSLGTGFVLLDRLPLGRIAGLLAALGFLVAAAVGLAAARETASGARRVLAPAAAILAAAAAFFAAPSLHDGVYEKLQLQGEYRPGFRFAEVIETKSGVITVTPEGTVYGGGAYDGGFNLDPVADQNQIVRAYALAALHPAPRKVLMVGLGSGAWAQAVAHHPAVESLTVVEINAGYLELLRGHEPVRGLLSDPRVRIEIDDGRRWLHRNADRFDAIVQNTTHNWRAHITNLLSVEYLDLVRAHLATGGVYWSNSTWSEAFLRTAASHFPHARRFRSFVAVSDAPLAVELGLARRRLLEWTIGGRTMFDPADAASARRLDEILGLGDWEDRPSILARTASARLITDDNMATEWWLWR